MKSLIALGLFLVAAFVSPSASWDTATAAKLDYPNTFTSDNTFNGGIKYGIQSFAESASWTGTVSESGGSIIRVTGSGASGTLTLPSAPATGTIFTIIQEGASSFTLTAGGTTLICGGTTLVMNTMSGTAPNTGTIQFNGTAYVNCGFGIGPQQLNSSVNIRGGLIISGIYRPVAQTISGSGTLNAGFTYLYVTGSGSRSIALPTGPATGDTYTIFDSAGSATAGNISLTSSDKAINGTAAGGGAVAVIILNWGRCLAVYNGTQWVVS
jgi:hypothetical protein